MPDEYLTSQIAELKCLTLSLKLHKGSTFLVFNEFAFIIFKISFWKMNNQSSLVNQSGMITSNLTKIKYVIVSFINVLGKPANNNLLIIRNISKSKPLLIILAPCNSTVMVLDVNKVCFDEEKNFPNTHEKSRKNHNITE